MVQYQEGSLEAFRELYAYLAPDLRRYVRFLTRGSDAADDLLQEAFLQLHRSRAAYNPAYAVRPWMFGLARNVCLMNRRAMRRWANIHAVGSDLPDVPVPPDVDRLADADAIRQGLAELPADHAEALTARLPSGSSLPCRCASGCAEMPWPSDRSSCGACR
jgi:RNA polymerase sigma-70 factor (ECF subfamily)